MRIRNKKWTDAELVTNTLLISKENIPLCKGNWRSLFGVSQNTELELEIGCGKGKFITALAAQNPNSTFVALEREPKIIASAARAVRLAQLKNVRFICVDAKSLLEIFDNSELNCLYINFCDPWDRKKKWHKRRLTHHSFLAIYRQILHHNGQICLKTDNPALFDFSLSEFAENHWQISQCTRNLHAEPYAPSLLCTEYEEKFVSLGFPIYRACWTP